MSSPLDPIIDGLVNGLARQVRQDGLILDALTGNPSPADHYAQISTALALYLRDPGDARWRKPVDAWLALPATRLGHEPFNRFLFLMLSNLNGMDASEVASIHSRCRLLQRYPSNNWSLLAQLCRLIEAPPGAARISSAQELLRMLDRWTTQAGGFVDYPEHPRLPGGGATPMAYHHKALFVATVAAWHVESPELVMRVRKLLDWVLLCWDCEGHVGGFGRSTHALFGDACLLASLLLLGFGDERFSHTPAGRVFHGVTGRIARQRRQDGLLWLNPAGHPEDGAGWDAYMHLSVYNAWAGGILSWARHMRQALPTPAMLDSFEGPGEPQALMQDAEAGLVCFQPNSGGVMLLSTRGQTPQAFSASEVELRYAGAVPFHLRMGHRLLCPAPARFAVERLLDEPALAGWTPIFVIGGDLFGLTDFEVQEVRKDGSELRVRLQGHPCQLVRRPAKGLVRRLLAAIDWRFLGGALGRRQALRREVYRPLAASLDLHWSPEQSRLTHELELEHRGSCALTYLNPGGHAVVSDALPSVRQLDIQQGENPSSRIAGFSEIVMDSSIPGAIACATQALDLQPGLYRQRLLLEW